MVTHLVIPRRVIVVNTNEHPRARQQQDDFHIASHGSACLFTPVRPTCYACYPRRRRSPRPLPQSVVTFRSRVLSTDESELICRGAHTTLQNATPTPAELQLLHLLVAPTETADRHWHVTRIPNERRVLHAHAITSLIRCVSCVRGGCRWQCTFFKGGVGGCRYETAGSPSRTDEIRACSNNSYTRTADGGPTARADSTAKVNKNANVNGGIARG